MSRVILLTDLGRHPRDTAVPARVGGTCAIAPLLIPAWTAAPTVLYGTALPDLHRTWISLAVPGRHDAVPGRGGPETPNGVRARTGPRQPAAPPHMPSPGVEAPEKPRQ